MQVPRNLYFHWAAHTGNLFQTGDPDEDDSHNRGRAGLCHLPGNQEEITWHCILMPSCLSELPPGSGWLPASLTDLGS